MLPILFLLVVVSSSAGQGGAFNDIALKSGAWVAAGATVRFCTAAATGVPCSPLASVYSDAALTTPLANPTTADISGNISGIYAAPGNYNVQVSGTGLTTRTYTVTIPPDVSNAAWSSNFRGVLNVKIDCAGVVYDGVTDDGAAVNSCIAANPKKRLFFPCVGNASGFDMYSSVALTVPTNFLLGCGGSYAASVGTILKFGAGSGGLILTGGSVTVADLNIVGSDPAPSSAAQAEGVNLLIPAASVMNEYNKTISTISRTADVVTVRFTNVPHWFPANGIVTISGVAEDPTFNGTFYIATTSQANTGGASSFTYSQVGAPDVVQFSPAAATVSLATTYVAAGNGIEIRQSFVHLQNVSVEKFGLNGIAVMGSSFVADDWRLDNVNVRLNRAHGFKCMGGDCNAGTSLHLSPYFNGLWGIFDVGFLGNTHIAPQASYNFGGAGQKPVAGAAKTITSIARTAGVLSVTTSTAHGFSVGHGIFFAGTSGALYDTAAGTVGCFVATVPTTSSFTCLQPGYNLADQGSTAAGTVRLGSWAEVTTGAAIDGGPFTVGRTGSAGHWLMIRPYDEGGQGPNKYSGSVMVQQPHSGGGIDVKWTAGQTTTVTSTSGAVTEGNSPTFKVSTDSAQFFNFQAGATADQFEYVQWKNQAGTVKWGLRADPTTGSAAQWGMYNGDPNAQTNPCFVVFRGTGTIETRINAGCAEAGSGAAQVKINAGNNSGTGGLEVYSGGATSTKVGGMDGSGILTWAQQTTAANKYVTAGVPTGTRTVTYPDASFTVPGLSVAQSFTAAQTFTQQLIDSVATGTAPFSITSTTPVANLTTVPTTYNSGGTQQTAVHLVFGKCTLGTDCAITLSGAAIFTGTDSYECTATDQTAAAAVRVNQTSGSAVAFTGTGTDVIRYQCVGN
jgi:hypothetical protein